MAKLKLDLHDIFNKGDLLEQVLGLALDVRPALPGPAGPRRPGPASAESRRRGGPHKP